MLPQNVFGRLSRTLKKVQPFVWIVNQHSEPITVVVSQFGPNWELSGVGINASATGAGFDLSLSVRVCVTSSAISSPSFQR